MNKVYFVLQKIYFSSKIILSSSVPSKRERLEVIQVCEVLVGRPVSLSRFEGEAVSVSLCTLIEVSCEAVAVNLVFVGV